MFEKKINGLKDKIAQKYSELSSETNKSLYEYGIELVSYDLRQKQMKEGLFAFFGILALAITLGYFLHANMVWLVMIGVVTFLFKLIQSDYIIAKFENPYKKDESI